MYQGNFVDISLENDYNDDNYQGKVQLATLNPFRYRSYYFDEETGLYYLNSRYYDAAIGRFINADSLEILENTKEIINGLNLFAYCLNNPVNTSDDNGDIPNWLKWLIGALIIVTAAVLTVVTAGGFAAAGAAFAGAIGIGATVSGAAGFFASVTVGAVIAGGIGLLAGGISSAVSGGNFWDGAADGFMWGSIGGALSGGYGSFFNNTGLILNSAGKAVGSIPQIIGQSVISVGTYIAQSFANNQAPTFIGIISSIFGATVGGLLAYTVFSTQFIINALSEGLKVAIDAFKQVISKLFKFDPQNNNWFW